MPKRSRDREVFLQDILCTAVEGGIGYWSAASGYHWSDENPSSACVGLHVEQDDPLAPVVTFHVNIDSIATGVRRIVDGEPREYCAERIRQDIVLADRENDAGEVDAEAADVIVQVAIFNEVVYG